MTSEFFPEQTIRYKTYAKRTIVNGLNSVFKGHPDELLQRTQASIEYPRTEADYPSVVVRMFEREIFNAGVGHEERISLTGESDSIEVSIDLPKGGTTQLNWRSIDHAIGYKVYRGTGANKEDRSFIGTGTSFTDVGNPGGADGVPTVVTANVDTPQPSVIGGPAAPGGLNPGTYYYRVTALTPSQVIKFRHYFYTADIEFAIYALSAYDRDLISDTLVQMIAMGTLEAYTSNFYERVYPSNNIFPDSELHFINVNSDQIQGFGENQSQTPWGAEDDLLYSSSYRIGVFGELYSLPPKLTYEMVRQITLYPYIGSLEPVPTGNPADPAPWVSNDNPL